MIRFISLLLIAIWFSSCSEKQDRIFTFIQIGWTFELPKGFKSLDSAVINSKHTEAKEIIKSSTGKMIEDKQEKIIFAAKKDNGNYFSFSLTSIHENQDINWQNSNQETKAILYETLKKQVPNGQFDSLNTIEIIDSVRFNKFIVIGKVNNITNFNFVMLSKLYKGYNFEINYLTKEKNVRLEIETMLKKSRFIR